MHLCLRVLRTLHSSSQLVGSKAKAVHCLVLRWEGQPRKQKLIWVGRLSMEKKQRKGKVWRGIAGRRGGGGREEERKIGSSGDLMVSSSHLRSTTALSAERPFLSWTKKGRQGTQIHFNNLPSELPSGPQLHPLNSVCAICSFQSRLPLS